MHVTQMETQNKYIEMIPTIMNSLLAVASMEAGNIPFFRGYCTKYHLGTTPHCVEEPVRPDTPDSPGIASRDAPGAQKYQESPRRKVQQQSPSREG